ncbi:tRNA 2-thiouridine(34) synthase MnmA [Candidatus Kaiserbacteria bacterium CG10_big_fil_rev_8_21_14_0_10_49_17]|uniref:tRNA-specific 2-thiouridylase MnmA n=1 Tax=Candidatus Kaiserbacteria bacterium CG10_big_fil_rev_8_21_14_0_10_49_17 TaxID=1974609 RepID=A0A2M6WF73_9BACT|nr:MAG: tRNA 2-thiouridine(34) synthase MnmA [Candidatus Kaiserbacteria bacterium CG10_big_fil_rev_8_21_14_0_10_49_17]
MSDTQKTIFVGLSGGVDSSVAAHILKNQGYAVVGVFIKIWQPEFIHCTWEEDRAAALRSAAHLEIPFQTLDLSDVYKKEVIDYLIAEYTAGRTPNPDVMCNRSVKFGAFLDYALAEGADAIATGHYGAVEEKEGAYALLQPKDKTKDQTYFLWTLTQQQLSRSLFPLYAMTKDEVRAYAVEHRLPSATRSESQGLCFIGDVEIRDFIRQYIPTNSGAVLNEAGAVIGEHEGAILYTYGQRHGFTVTSQKTDERAHFVIAKDIEKNTITVRSGSPEETAAESITLENTHWIREVPHGEADARTRHRGALRRAVIEDSSVSLAESAEKPSPGQSLVLYKDGECLGGGIIATSDTTRH